MGLGRADQRGRTLAEKAKRQAAIALTDEVEDMFLRLRAELAQGSKAH